MREHFAPMMIAMLLHKSVEHDSRVRREARALQKAGHEVTVIHLPRAPGELEGELDGYQVVSATPPAWVRRRLPFHLYRVVFLVTFVRALWRLRPDAVHAHDCTMLVPGYIGSRLRRVRPRLVYDSHEYAVGVAWRTRVWAALVWAIERVVVPRCDAVITVSDGIADRLQERYRLRARPMVVRNVPDPEMYDEKFEAPDLREGLAIPADAPLVLHLGAVAESRGCETLVRAMGELGDAHLLFLGADDGDYTATLATVAAEAGLRDRVHFRPAVPVSQVAAYTRQADVGVSLLEDTCENHRLALPNKVFEYLAASLPVVVSDLPEVSHLAGRDARLAVTRVEPGPLASALRASLVNRVSGEQRDPRKCWDRERAPLLRLYRDGDEGGSSIGEGAPYVAFLG